MTSSAHETGGVPELRAGDRLTRDEFELRYRAMPHVKKAELIEGVVYMPSPVSHQRHSGPHARAVTWLGTYSAYTPGVDVGDNATVRLDSDNVPQPDVFLRVLPERGGSSRTVDGYVEGPPELACEITASRASYDLHDKLRAYVSNGVREYLVWRVDEAEIDWFELRGEVYERLEPDPEGVVRSEVFPGLWLDVRALLVGDMRRVLEVLARGLANAEHGAFVERVAAGLDTDGSASSR